MRYLLFYEYVPDIVERRVDHRDRHLAYVRRWMREGRLELAGAYGDPPRGALLVLHAADGGVAEDFVRGDPYVEAGLVVAWHAEPWAVVD